MEVLNQGNSGFFLIVKLHHNTLSGKLLMTCTYSVHTLYCPAVCLSYSNVSNHRNNCPCWFFYTFIYSNFNENIYNVYMYIFMQFLSFVKYIHKIEKTKNSVLSRLTTENCREKNQNRHLPREKDIFRYMYQVPV